MNEKPMYFFPREFLTKKKREKPRCQNKTIIQMQTNCRERVKNREKAREKKKTSKKPAGSTISNSVVNEEMIPNNFESEKYTQRIFSSVEKSMTKNKNVTEKRNRIYEKRQ